MKPGMLVELEGETKHNHFVSTNCPVRIGDKTVGEDNLIFKIDCEADVTLAKKLKHLVLIPFILPVK